MTNKRDVGTGRVLRLPNPPTPMTASTLMSYLEHMADRFPIEDAPVMFQGQEIVNAHVVDDRVVLMTFKDMLNEDPPCGNHYPVQHRDNKPPWCYLCRLTVDWENPHE